MATSKLGLHGTPIPDFFGNAAGGGATVYRWRGKILMHQCNPGGGDPFDRALAVGPNCCCPPCVAPCCCTDSYGNNGVCLYQIRSPVCCEEVACTTYPSDPNISGDPPNGPFYYQGGITQIVGYKAFYYTGTQHFVLSSGGKYNPFNDYYLAAVYTQNQPSWLNYEYCLDKARYQWNFHAGCTFYIPVCIESYLRDPYCTAEYKDNCDPCANTFTDCCGSTLVSISQGQIISTTDNYLIVHECPACNLTPGATCAEYPPSACRTGSTPLMYLFNFTGCAGSVSKDCCYITQSYIDNNFHSKWNAVLASATLVGALECNGTDNNPGGIGSEYTPMQDTFDCAYLTPYQ